MVLFIGNILSFVNVVCICYVMFTIDIWPWSKKVWTSSSFSSIFGSIKSVLISVGWGFFAAGNQPPRSADGLIDEFNQNL